MDSVEESRKGNLKKFFELVDAAGYWLQFCAMGRHDMNKVVKSGSQFVLYFGTGRAQVGESVASVYLFHDAAIMHTGFTQMPINKRIQIQIAYRDDEDIDLQT